MSKIFVLRKSAAKSLCIVSRIRLRVKALFWCSWNSWVVAVGLPLRLPPDFMREKWTQTVIGSLVFLYTCRLLRPHNCVIQVACQSCERSSQAHVDVGLIYIVEGETKTAQPKWNIWIVLSCQKGLCHTGSSVPSLSPQRALPYSVCSANFGGLAGWSALWLCFMVTFKSPQTGYTSYFPRDNLETGTQHRREMCWWRGYTAQQNKMNACLTCCCVCLQKQLVTFPAWRKHTT